MRGILIVLLVLSITSNWACQPGSQASPPSASQVSSSASESSSTESTPVTSSPASIPPSIKSPEPGAPQSTGQISKQQKQLLPAAKEFDGKRAYGYIEHQCSFGPRVPGFEGHRKTRDFIVNHMKKEGWTTTLQPFRKHSDLINKTLNFENIIARLDTPSTRTVVLSCHWDTRPIADQDPKAINRNTPILGANDAGSGVAVLLELATVFKKHPPSVDLIFLFFDAEDYGDDPIPGQWCMGSQYMADNPPDNFDFVVGVNIDMVGERNLGANKQLFYIEQNSLRTAEKWTVQIWTVGSILYPQQFSFTPTSPIIDDHLAFVEKGLPYLNIIDLDYPEWHTISDTPDKCAPESLNRIGKTLLQWLFTYF